MVGNTFGLNDCLCSAYSDNIHYTGDKELPAQGCRAVLQDKAKIQPNHAERLRKQLFALDNAKSSKDMNAPGWRLHPLHGELEGHWAVDVSGNWRLIFAFKGEDAVLVDYRDYH
jgi:proteic killer suppression protein